MTVFRWQSNHRLQSAWQLKEPGLGSVQNHGTEAARSRRPEQPVWPILPVQGLEERFWSAGTDLLVRYASNRIPKIMIR